VFSDINDIYRNAILSKMTIKLPKMKIKLSGLSPDYC